MSTLTQPYPDNQAPITFWDSFDELNSLVRAIVYKVTRRHNLGIVTFQSHIDDLMQLGWQTLLEAQASDPTEPKGKIMARVAWTVQRYIWKQVFSLYRDDNRKTVSCLNFWKVAGAENEAYDPGRLDAYYTVDYQPFGASSTASPEMLIADAETEAPSADELIERFIMRWSDRSFLFHRLPFDKVQPTDPELEHALFVLLCATQTYGAPSSKLHADTKRKRAYIIMRRLQGADNVTIGQEIDLYRVNVGAHVQAARRTIERWLKLSRGEQLAALRLLQTKHPTINSVSLAHRDREDAVFDPQDVRYLEHSADMLLHHVQSRYAISPVEWDNIAAELRQVVLLHLISSSAAGQSAQDAYRAAEREVCSFIDDQLRCTDPRWDWERDKQLTYDAAHDVGHASWELFANGDGRRVPEPLTTVSAEWRCVQLDLAHEHSQHWQQAEAQLTNILLAMSARFSAKRQQAAQASARMLTLRLRFGDTDREIARVTGRSLHTVRTLLQQAKQQVQAFLALSADAQAARLLKAAFAQEPPTDMPTSQSRAMNRPIAVVIAGERCTLSYRRQRHGEDDLYAVYLNARQTPSGSSQTPSVYVGPAASVTIDDVHAAFGKLQTTCPQLVDGLNASVELPLAGD